MAQQQAETTPINVITCLNAKTAAAIDQELMSPDGFNYSIDQLMELAGLSCAQGVYELYSGGSDAKKKVLVVCGPGNNGGDGLVCGRHLQLFGFDVTVVYPKEPKQDLYKHLLAYLRMSKIPILTEMPKDLNAYDIFIDSIFGFSFDPKDGIREPYKSIIQQLVSIQSTRPIVSIDIPSGWDVNAGDSESIGLNPSCLISLTAPKDCAIHFKGSNKYHLLGGRFMTKELLHKYGLTIPPYKGSSIYQDITHCSLQPSNSSNQ